MEDIDIFFKKFSVPPSERGNINMHKTKKAKANHDLFVFNRYPLNSLIRNVKNSLVNFQILYIV